MLVLRKDEDEWWYAKHEDGREGSIPLPYVKVVSVTLPTSNSQSYLLLPNHRCVV